MPPQLNRITSFNLDVEDWYSCHTSDDEAYQDALERNSIASFFTAQGAASTAASIVNTSIAIGSPSRLADADQALAEMVPEPIGDIRPQREPPELDEEDAPLLKRTRSVCTGLVTSVSSPTRSSTPSTKAKPGFKPSLRRGGPLRPVTTIAAPTVPTARPAQPATPTAGPLRVCISVEPSGASVRLNILPSIFCFGDVPLPGIAAGATDYSAVLLGSQGDQDKSPSCGRAAPQLPSIDTDEAPVTPRLEEAAKLEVDCAVSLVTRPRGITPFKTDGKLDDFIGGISNDPATPKDQDQDKRQAAAKAQDRKSGGGFPVASLLQRLFSGLRQSRGCSVSSERSLAPATVRELGSELLMSSAASTAAQLASAAQAVPVIAGFVQATGPAAGPPGAVVAAAPTGLPAEAGAALAAAGALDEAAAAAQRLSAEIFRNVLRASSGGADSSTPKSVISPRDTAQRDRNSIASAVGGALTASTPTRYAVGVVSAQQQEEVASAGAVPSGGASANAAAAAAGELTPILSVEGLDCGGLPMPELEQCESPVTVNAPHPVTAAVSDAATDSAAASEQTEVPVSAGAAGTRLEELVATEASPAAASPRTVSKRAYGTVARLVKKMAPEFSVSTSAMQVPVCTAGVPYAEAGDLQQPLAEGPALVTEAAAACLVTVPLAGSGEPMVKSSLVQGGHDSEEPSTTAAVAAEEKGESVATTAAGVDASVSTPATAPPSDQGSEPSGQTAPSLFVFGQEPPKTAKHPVIKARSFTAKAAACSAVDETAGTSSETAGRKRKADEEILPNAKVPVTAERTSSGASQDELTPTGPSATNNTIEACLPSDLDPTSPPQPAAEVETQPSSSCEVETVAERAPAVVESRPTTGAASDQPAVGADAAESGPKVEMAATEQVAVDVKPAGQVAPVEPRVRETPEPAAAAAIAQEPHLPAGASPAAEQKEVAKADRTLTPAEPALVDSKHSPSDVEKHDEVTGTKSPAAITTVDVAPLAGTALVAPATSAANTLAADSGTGAKGQLVGSAGVQPEPALAAVATTAVPSADADDATAQAVGTVKAEDAGAQASANGAAAGAAKAVEQLVKDDPFAVQASRAEDTSAVREDHVVLSPVAAAKDVETVPTEVRVPAGAPAEASLAATAPVTAPGATGKAPVAETQTPADALATEVPVQKPAESTKHKRRGSFALFACFRP